VSLRPGRALLGLLVGMATLAAVPASALASGETLIVTPANTQAGGLTSVTATLTFDPSDTPATVVTSLAPGMLGNLNANPGCLAAQQLTASCQVGTATVGIAGGASLAGNLYLVPPQGSDAAGLELVPGAGPLANQYIGVSLNPSVPGGLNLTTTFPQVSGVQITSFSASFTTLNGQPFTRLPSSCNPATSSFSVTYYDGTPSSQASNAFTPTGCQNLAYAPTLSGRVTKDAKDSGATLAFGVTQAAGESASRSLTLKLPSGLGVNALAVANCLTGSSCTVGSAAATSPLLPSAALAGGTVTLGGSLQAPTLSIAFRAPFAIALTGSVNLTSKSVTFESIPDVPLTNLALTITGPGGSKAFTTDCAPANVTGTFNAQSGASHTDTVPVTDNGCVTVTGSAGGLAAGHPTLKFKLARAKGGANIASVAVALPGGLRFSRSAFVSHKTCTTLKGKKKKCTTTTLISGLGISGGRAKSVTLKGKTLLIGLAKATGSVSLTISKPLVTATKSLRTKVKKHKAGNLTFTFKVTDAKGTVTTVTASVTPH
jgi:hypothetical protein